VHGVCLYLRSVCTSDGPHGHTGLCVREVHVYRMYLRSVHLSRVPTLRILEHAQSSVELRASGFRVEG
jgi:hypothetical protein